MAAVVPIAIAAASAAYGIYSTEKAKSNQADAVTKQNDAIMKAATEQNALIDQQVGQNLGAFGVTTAGGKTVIDPNADPNATAAGQTIKAGKAVSGNLNAQAGAAGIMGGAGTSAGTAGQNVLDVVSSQLDQIVQQADQLQKNAAAQERINITNAEVGVAVNNANLEAFNARATNQQVQSILNFGIDALNAVAKSYKPKAAASDFGISSTPGSANGFVYGTGNKPDWMY